MYIYKGIIHGNKIRIQFIQQYNSLVLINEKKITNRLLCISYMKHCNNCFVNNFSFQSAGLYRKELVL